MRAMPGKQKDPVHDHFVDVVVRETVTVDKGVETVINKTNSIEVPALACTACAAISSAGICTLRRRKRALAARFAPAPGGQQ